jgi:hypothetical protein
VKVPAIAALVSISVSVFDGATRIDPLLQPLLNFGLVGLSKWAEGDAPAKSQD